MRYIPNTLSSAHGGLRFNSTERLWQTIKYEEVYLNEYNTPKEARQGIAKYIDFYNNQRPHQSLNYRTPAEVYFGDRTGEGACLTGT